VAVERQLGEVRAKRRALEADLRNQRELANKLRRLSLVGNPDAAMHVFELCQGRADAREALARLDLRETEMLQAELDSVLDKAERVRESNNAHGLQALQRESAAKLAGERIKELEEGLPGQRADVANVTARCAIIEDASGHRVHAHDIEARANEVYRDRSATETPLPRNSRASCRNCRRSTPTF
jgi:hypothetical protein